MADRDPVHQQLPGKSRLGTAARLYQPNLLPYEKQLLELTGLTEDEYRFFVAEAYKRSKIRPAEYDLVPDVQNGPVLVSALISLALGAVTTAVSYFLTPKPRAPQDQQQGTTQLSLASLIGGQRFTPTFGFDSQAELASYGDPIPIVFGRWTGTTGGILITPKLVWSRMFSYGRQQGVKLLFVVGEQGVTEGVRPDGIEPPALQGIFIGNGALDTIYNETFAFYWKRDLNNLINRRIQASDLLYGTRGTLASGDPENHGDVFSCPTRAQANDDAFSAAHGLSNNADFGCYSPIPNGSHYRVNWRVVSIPHLLNQRDDPGDNLTYERVKIAGDANGTGYVNGVDDGGTFRDLRGLGMEGTGRNYSRRMGITSLKKVGVATPITISNATGVSTQSVGVGDEITFTIAHNMIRSDYYKGTDREVSVDDINDATAEMRIAADDELQIGEMFMIGRTTWQVTARSLALWDRDIAQDQLITLKCIDSGTTANNIIGMVSDYMLRSDYINDNNTPIQYNAGSAFFPLMRVSEAKIRNTRPCDVTEFGIRSNVYQRLNNICNFKNVPSPQQLRNLDEKRVQVSTGTINAYIKRASLFTIFIRPAGLNPAGAAYTWEPIGEQFCVIGNQPIEQYNFIRVTHPDKRQYEYKFIPKNGADIGYNSPDTAEFWYLYNGGSLDSTSQRQILSANYTTAYGVFKLQAVGSKVTKLDIQHNDEFRNEPTFLDRTVVNDRPTSVGLLTFLPEFDDSLVSLGATEFASWYTDPVFEYTSGRNGAFTWELATAMGVGSADNYPGNDGTTVVRDYTWNISGNRSYKVRYTLRKTASIGYGQQFTWVVENETIIESSKNWTQLSEFTISFPVSASNPYRQPDQSPAFITIGQRRRVTSVINSTATQGRSQAFYEELLGPARNYATSTQRSAFIDFTVGSKYIRLNFSSTVYEDPAHWSGVTKLWTAPIITISSDTSKVSDNWSVGDLFTQTYFVGTSNPFRQPGSQVGAEFVIESRGQTYTQQYTYAGRSFESQSQYADVSFYGNLVEKSNANGPEHVITYVNEIVANDQDPQYSYMTTAGLALKASRNFTSLDQIRFWIKNGIPVKRFHPSESSEIKPSNLFCDLVYYMLTDRVAGVGDLLNMSVNSAPLINTTDFITTAKFLKTNSLFFDGAVASTVNIRQFIADTAPFMLCNFVISDGKFSLLPALPTDIGGNIQTTPVTIKQLFTAGNIFEDSFELNYISAEERKDFQAMMRFREERENQLPQERNIVVRWNETASTGHPLESFDMTQYCTSRAHAELVARFFLSIRRRITHSIQFKTSPYGIDLAPGDYIRVVTEANPYSSAQNGSIGATGIITSATTFNDGQYTILYYTSGSETVVQATMTVSGGVVQQTALYNSVFTVVNSTVSANVYQVEQITLDADGAVQINASHFPCNSSLVSTIALDVTNSGNFLVDL